MAAQEIKVPDIGDFDSVEVIEVLVSEGDTVEEEQALITLESDKATLEVPTTIAGKLTELKVAEGDTVSEGDVIAMVEADEEDGSASDDDSDDDDAGESEQADDASDSEDDEAESDDADDEPEDDDSEDDDAEDEDAGGETTEVKVPDIGDFDSVEVIEVLVSEGDEVEAEQALITLESDKATLEVPSESAGKITELKVKEGDTVSEGDVIAMLESAGGKKTGGGKKDKSANQNKSGDTDRARKSDQTSDKKADKKADKSDEKQPKKESRKTESDSTDDSSKLDDVDEQRFGKAHASPSVRKYAREIGADLGRVEGSGRKGRITEEDVQSYVKKALSQVQGGGASAAAPAGAGGVPAQPDIDFSQFGEVEIVELARIRKISAKAVHKNWLLIPHVTQFDNADITEMEAFRKANKEKAAKDGVKLTPLAFMLKAAAAALREFPDLNSSLTADGAALVHKKYCNIAVAVDTPGGLLMPVLKDVDQKGIYQLARELDDISGRARDGKLKGDEMKGACFSISSLGGVGGTAFTPIVNSPEVGILGVSKHSWQPVWNGSEFEPRLILPLSFSYDHRVIDGAKAARITGFLSEKLSDLRTLLL